MKSALQNSPGKTYPFSPENTQLYISALDLKHIKKTTKTEETPKTTQAKKMQQGS